jgi:hypothetical protein
MAHCSYHPDTFDPTCYTCEKIAKQKGKGFSPVTKEAPVAIKSPETVKSTSSKKFPFNILPWEDDINQDELDSVRHCFWVNPNRNPYWEKVILTIPDFKRAYPKMLEQSEGYTIPKPKKKSVAMIGKINCPKCHGQGDYNQLTPRPGSKISFISAVICDCAYEVEVGSPEFKAAMEAAFNYRSQGSLAFNTDDLDQSR